MNTKNDYCLSYLDYYKKEKTIPKIIELMKNEGFDINTENIKSWSKSKMSYNDILNGVSYVKSIDKNCILYTNKVPFKDELTQKFNIKIFDINDIEDAIVRQEKFELFDCFILN